jgi:hypothetical protein
MELNRRKIFHIHANGCAAHVLNLFIKDIVDHETFKKILTKVVSVVTFIKRRHLVLNEFNVLRKQYHISRGLVFQDGTHITTR